MENEMCLALARRLYAEQEARVRQQEELVTSLRAIGRPTESAEETLTSMNCTLVIILGEIARLGKVNPDDTN